MKTQFSNFEEAEKYCQDYFKKLGWEENGNWGLTMKKDEIALEVVMRNTSYTIRTCIIKSFKLYYWGKKKTWKSISVEKFTPEILAEKHAELAKKQKSERVIAEAEQDRQKKIAQRKERLDDLSDNMAFEIGIPNGQYYWRKKVKAIDENQFKVQLKLTEVQLKAVAQLVDKKQFLEQTN